MYIFIILIEDFFLHFPSIVHARQNAICYHALSRCIRRPSDSSRVETVKNYSHNSEAGNKGNHNFLYNLSPSHTTPFHLAIHLLQGAQQGDVNRSRISEREWNFTSGYGYWHWNGFQFQTNDGYGYTVQCIHGSGLLIIHWPYTIPTRGDQVPPNNASIHILLAKTYHLKLANLPYAERAPVSQIAIKSDQNRHGFHLQNLVVYPSYSRKIKTALFEIALKSSY